MATLIFIKKKIDPIRISNERGLKVKQLWLDDNTPRDTVVDLGEWAGELNQIKAIESEKEAPAPTGRSLKDIEAEEQKRKEEMEAFKKLPPEDKWEKLKGWLIGSFEMQWKFVTDWQGKPSEDHIEDFKREAFYYFDKNPEATKMPTEAVKEAVYKILNKPNDQEK